MRLQTNYLQEEPCEIPFLWSTLLQPATPTVGVRLVQTRLIVVNLMHARKRTKTVRAKAKAPERRTKFDPDVAMLSFEQISVMMFSRVQVGKEEIHLQMPSLLRAW